MYLPILIIIYSLPVGIAWCSHKGATPSSQSHRAVPASASDRTADVTHSIMEQGNNNRESGNEATAHCLHSKRLKELENAALQTTLISQMETESVPEVVNLTEQAGVVELTNGFSVSPRSVPPQLSADTEAEEDESGRSVTKERVEEERTLTDHLNKRLLTSFLEKLNERDLALPGVQRLDCAVADEDSNRAADEW